MQVRQMNLCGLALVVVAANALVSRPGLASGESKRDVERIVVVVDQQPGKPSQLEISDLKSALKATTFRLNHPDKVINPKKVELEYSGALVSALLEQAAGKPFGGAASSATDAARTISFIGRDSYTVSMPLGDALAGVATVVGFQGATQMTWRGGAPFLAFPAADRPAFLTEPSWWGWWISAIVVGEPEIPLTVAGKSMTLEVLGKTCGKKIEGELNYPGASARMSRRERPKARFWPVRSTVLALLLLKMADPTLPSSLRDSHVRSVIPQNTASSLDTTASPFHSSSADLSSSAKTRARWSATTSWHPCESNNRCA